jgi:hypothetical protein
MPNSLIKPITITLMLAVVLTIFTVQAAVKIGSYVGTWKSNVTYVAGDLITYSDKTFLSLVAKNKNKNPIKTPNAWQLLGGVGAGSIGLTGPQGAQGPKGDQGMQGVAGPAGLTGQTGADSTVAGPRGAPGNPTAGTDVGDMQYWDGSTWVMIPAPLPVRRAATTGGLQFCNGVPGWNVGSTCVYTPDTTPNTSSPYHIGDNGPAGGIIFYITDAGFHGLEAAPVDQGIAAWGCTGNSISGAQSTAVGTGAANTAAIVAGCSEANTAAKVADAYVLNGFTDWYLSSKDELNLLYGQKVVVGGFTAVNYWSSTEFEAVGAWGYEFEGGTPEGGGFKNLLRQVRAVRDF